MSEEYNCNECGKEMSDEAASCPHCGKPCVNATNSSHIRRSVGFWFGLGVMILPFIFVWFLVAIVI